MTPTTIARTNMVFPPAASILFVTPDLDQMIVGVVEVQSGGHPLRAKLFTRSCVGAYRIKGGPIGDSSSFDPFQDLSKLRARYGKCIMLVAGGSPGCELKLKIRIDPDDSKGTIDSLVIESQNLCVEQNAGIQIVHLQNQVIEGSHRHINLIPFG